MRNLFKIVAILLLAVVVSCASEKIEEEIPELYWPLPPQRPRIKFVDIIIGSLDVTGSQRGKFKMVLFGEEGEIGFTKPVFAASLNGVVYVSDLNGIKVLDFRKKKFKVLGTANFINPTGIAVSKSGKLFVADSAQKRVFVLDLKTEKVEPLSSDKFSNPGGIAVDDNNGRLVITDVKGHLVKVYTLDGEEIFSFGGRGVEPGEMNFPYDVTVDSSGNIYVVDSGNFRVQIFDSQGKFLRTFGTVGTLPGQFARPKGISLDSEEHIYVIDGAFGNFQIFDKKGRPLLAVGVVGSEPGQFMLPIGITIDVDDSIYIVDQLNHRIQKFEYIKYPDEQ